VKIHSLYRIAEERGADFIATGHYARLVRDGSGYNLCRAHDVRKDQSYFLYRINPTWLPRLLFPLGSMQKSEVWARAEALGLPADELKESQEICFVAQGDYRSFIESEAPASRRPGNFIDTAGNVLGRHEGIAYYTPGQRRGLGIATGQRLYVQKVVAESQTVVLGLEESLFDSRCSVADLNLFDPTCLSEPRQADVKVRYATPAAPAELVPNQDGSVTVQFRIPQRALSPGQSAVFYDGDRVLGGGVIQST
jgi:tRNA-specific 2-thiouridylase